MRNIVLFAAVSWVAAGQPVEPLEAALGASILDPKQPLIEVQVYTAARVPPVPTFRTAEEWRQYAGGLRSSVEKLVLRGEAQQWSKAPRRVEWLDTLPGDGFRIRKLRYEAIPGLWVPALLYEPAALTGKAPVVLNVNGHEAKGVSTPYIQLRAINLAKRGFLALNPEWFGRGQMNFPNFQHYRINQLDLFGTSGVAVHYLSMKRALDILIEHQNADPRRVAVTGLSGGGWQTILLSALDTRVAASNPVAGYSSFITRAQWPELDLGDSEQTPSDMATVADYTHLTALLAPRPALLTYNAKDNCCFRADYAVSPLLAAARPVYALLGAPNHLRYHLNHDAGHNYDLDNRQAFYRLLAEHLVPGLPLDEISRETEVRGEDRLRVPLPDGNSDFVSIAKEVSRKVQRKAGGSVASLRDLVRAKEWRVVAQTVRDERVGEIAVRSWRLHLGDDWTVPAVEMTPPNAVGTTLLVADSGRKAALGLIRERLGRRERVVALDPFYLGESAIGRRDFLFALLVAAVGDRPLGVQASQIAAAARWLARERSAAPVKVAAEGQRTSLMALVAAAIEPDAIAGIELRGSMTSFSDVLEQNLSADKTPEMFCFGLATSFDIPDLIGMVKPRAVTLLP